VVGADREMAQYASNLPLLIENIRSANGHAIIAHPYDPEAPAFNESDISWQDWDTNGIHGIEIWNGLSEFKSLLRSKFHAIYYAYNPNRIASGPFTQVLKKWDEILVSGKKVFAVGGSDAHALKIRLGPIRKTIFPYKWHFQGINTHLLLPSELTGELVEDKKLIYDALSKGNSFIGYDLPAKTKGFRFTGNSLQGNVSMGEESSARGGITFQIRLPRPAECVLVYNGRIIKTWQNREVISHITTEPGVYRVEAYINYLGKRRGWIFSNPIYVTK
jgi:hypothetical protein